VLASEGYFIHRNWALKALLGEHPPKVKLRPEEPSENTTVSRLLYVATTRKGGERGGGRINNFKNLQFSVKIVAEPQLSVLQEMLVTKLEFEKSLYNILGLNAVKLFTF
jgi:hypothetical protein